MVDVGKHGIPIAIEIGLEHRSIQAAPSRRIEPMLQVNLSNSGSLRVPTSLDLPKHKQSELLERAVSQQDIAELTRLLNAGVNPAARTGRSFVIAAYVGFSEGISLLWERHENRDDSLRKVLNFALAQCVANRVASPQTVVKLLEYGATFNKEVYQQASGAWWRKKLDGLISSGLARRCSDQQKDRIMEHAIKLNHVEMVRHLHEHGMDITANDNQALRLAAENGSFEIVRYLAENGADVTAHDNEALIHAARFGNLETLQYLCENGADVTARDSKAIRCDGVVRDLEIVKFLHHKGASLTANVNELFALALANGSVEVVRYLHENGVKPDYNDDFLDDNQGIGNALTGCDAELLECLVDVGVDVERLFSKAAVFGSASVLKYLHECGADITANDNEATRNALLYGDLGALKYLLDNGARLLLDENSFQSLGEQPLEFLRYVRQSGVDIGVDGPAQKLIRAAAVCGQVEALRYLHENGGSLTEALNALLEEVESSNNRTRKQGDGVFEEDSAQPLHQLAAFIEYTDVLRYLYESGNGLIQIPATGRLGTYFELVRHFDQQREKLIDKGCIRQVRDALARKKPGQLDYGARLASAAAWAMAQLHQQLECVTLELF